MIKVVRAAAAVFLIAIFFAGCTGQGSTTTPSSNGPNSKVKIVVYADPKCHACYTFYTDIEPELIARYVLTGKASLETLYLSTLGLDSSAAAQAIMCAGDQGKSEEYREAILSAWEENGVSVYSQSELIAAAGRLGMDTGVFSSCLVSGKYRQTIANNVVQAGQLNVSFLPTTFVNDVRIQGSKSLETYIAAIEDQLN